MNDLAAVEELKGQFYDMLATIGLVPRRRVPKDRVKL